MPHSNIRIPLPERFWHKVVKTKTCWLWTGSIKPSGHGYFDFHGTYMSAQRISWILTYGVLLPGLCVCHKCPNRHCVRPSHLYIGSRGDNRRDGNRKPNGTGRLLDYRKPVIDPLTRFWNNVLKTDTCWLWTPEPGRKYGRFSYQGKSLAAHRFSWELSYGPIPNGLFVLHSCDTPGCVNPNHLRIGTHLDNMHDRSERGRSKDMKNAPYSYTNPELTPKGEKNIKAVLIEEEVVAIRALYKTRAASYRHELSYESIAKQYSVTKSTIAFVIQGRTWKHLPL